MSFENTVGKGEMACDEQFLLFPQCFQPVWIIFPPFSSNLKLSSANSAVRKSLTFVVLEKVNVPATGRHLGNTSETPIDCARGLYRVP